MGNLFSNSKTESKSNQRGTAYITQQFAGTCEIVCENIIGDVDETIINSYIEGDVGISQTCSTNGSCLIGSNSDALSDIAFVAKNSSNASSSKIIGDADAVSEGRQQIRQNFRQSSNEKCNITSYNQTGNVSILAANSYIGGNVQINQQGSSSGQCQLNNSLTAAARASGDLEDDTKAKKDKAAKFSMITWIAIAVVVLVVAGMMAKGFSMLGKRKSSSSPAMQQDLSGMLSSYMLESGADLPAILSSAPPIIPV